MFDYKIVSIENDLVEVESKVNGLVYSFRFGVTGPITVDILKDLVDEVRERTEPLQSIFPKVDSGLLNSRILQNPIPIDEFPFPETPSYEDELASIFETVSELPDLSAQRFIDWLDDYLSERENDGY